MLREMRSLLVSHRSCHHPRLRCGDSLRCQHNGPPYCTRVLDCKSTEPADSSSHGESYLAVPFRKRTGSNAERLRIPGVSSHSSGVAGWLAARFIKEGWSIKAMHRLIMSSATYQMSSAPRADAWEKDPTNELFWRFDMRRLTAEEIRDSILWANGTLNADSMYGPSIYTKIPKEVMAGQSMPGAGWSDSSAEDRARRSIYIHVKRSLLDPVLESFDFADTDQSCPVRFSTTSPRRPLEHSTATLSWNRHSCLPR